MRKACSTGGGLLPSTSPVITLRVISSSIHITFACVPTHTQHNTTHTHTHTVRHSRQLPSRTHTGGTGAEGGESKRAMKGKIIQQHGKKCSKQEDRRSRILRLCKPCNGLSICEHDRMKSDARTEKDAQEIVADLPFLGP